MMKLPAARQKQQGYGLIEMLVGMALVGILGTGIATFTIQSVTQSHQSSFHMYAIQQLGNTGFWLTRDVQMAQTVTPGVNNGFPLQLRWRDENYNIFNVTYSIDGAILQRTLVENTEPPLTMILLRTVDSTPTLTFCTYTNSVLTFTLTSTVKTWSLTRTWEIMKRPW